MTLGLVQPLIGTLDEAQDRVTGVEPGEYTHANITVDATGRIVHATSGLSGGYGAGPYGKDPYGGEQPVSPLPARKLLTANLDWYASPIGSNDNPGTAELPFADPAYAYTLAQQTLDLAGKYTITVHLQGSFSGANWYFYGPLVGWHGPRSFIISGSGPSTVVSGNTGAFVMTAADFGGFRATNFTMAPGTGGFGFVAMSMCGSVYVENAYGHTSGCHTMFDACGSGCNVVVSNFTLTASGPSMNYVAVAEDTSNIALTGAWVLNSPAWNIAFCQADLAGMIDATGLTWTGPSSGPRFNAVAPGIVFTGIGSSPPNFFPGNAPGVGVNPWYQ